MRSLRVASPSGRTERERPVPLTRFESDERGPAVCEADHQPTLHPPTALPLAVTPGTAAAPS